MKLRLHITVSLWSVLIIMNGCHRQDPPAPERHKPLLNQASIAVGMNTAQVISRIGNPKQIDRDPENQMQAWTYMDYPGDLPAGTQPGGLVLFIKGDVVMKVDPIRVSIRKN